MHAATHPHHGALRRTGTGPGPGPTSPTDTPTGRTQVRETQILLLVAGTAAVAGLARWRGWSPPLLLVLTGLALSFVPGVPSYRLDPNVVLLLFLPPLLFSAALDSSYVSFRSNLRPIGLLSVGLVLFTTVVVGLVAHAVVPGLGMPAALTLGAIVAPPDAVAATSVGRAVGLPRRVVAILAGESLVNDATALTAYRVAVAAVVGGGFSLLSGVGQFVYAVVLGVTVGAVVAVGTSWLAGKLADPVLENALWLLVPFVAFLPVERLGGSGVLAVVVAGLYVGHTAPRLSAYATRLQGGAIWRMIDFLLEAIVFALIGLQLRTVVDGLPPTPAGQLVLDVVAVVAAVVLTRVVWMFPATYLPRWLFPRIAARDPAPPWRVPAVLSWAGMRGVVSLAAAFALPTATDAGTPFPERSLIQFLTFCVVIATLVIQGYSLPAVIRRFGVIAEESRQDNLVEAAAQQAAARAALQRLDELLATEAGRAVPEEIVTRLRQQAEARALSAWERLGGQPGYGFVETPMASYRRLRLEMLEAERRVFVQMRDSGRIDDEVMRRVQQELDFEEATLTRE
jgi:monovalent cation/hydrogen antiporter